MRISRFTLLVVLTSCASGRHLSTNTAPQLERPAVDYDSFQQEADDADAAALRGLVEGALSPAMKARLRHDPRLDVLARVQFEQFAASGEGLRRDHIQWVMWRVGAAGTYARHTAWKAGTRTKLKFKGLDADLENGARGLDSLLGTAPGPLSYGVARGLAGTGHYAQALVVARRPVELGSVSKTVAPGAGFVVAGRLLQPMPMMRAATECDDGSETHVDAPVAADGSFRAELVAPAVPGRCLVSLGDPSGAVDLGSMPIFVGVAEPAEPDPVVDAVIETRRLQARMVALRKEAGHATVEDAALEAIARRTADSVCKAGKPPKDHLGLRAALEQGHYGELTIKTFTRNGVLFRLKKELTEGKPSVAILTCPILAGEFEGQQYVLIVAAVPK